MNQVTIVTVLVGALILSGGLAMVISYEPEIDKSYTQVDDPVCSRQLMTLQERAEYRAEMRAAQSTEDRLKIRNQYHELMTERALARGLLLPTVPPVSDPVTGQIGDGIDYNRDKAGPEQWPKRRTWWI